MDDSENCEVTGVSSYEYFAFFFLFFLSAFPKAKIWTLPEHLSIYVDTPIFFCRYGGFSYQPDPTDRMVKLFQKQWTPWTVSSNNPRLCHSLSSHSDFLVHQKLELCNKFAFIPESEVVPSQVFQTLHTLITFKPLSSTDVAVLEKTIYAFPSTAVLVGRQFLTYTSLVYISFFFFIKICISLRFLLYDVTVSAMKQIPLSVVQTIFTDKKAIKGRATKICEQESMEI